jgi:hypothetical protein
VVRVTDSAIWDATWSESEALKIRAGATYQEYEQWWQNTGSMPLPMDRTQTATSNVMSADGKARGLVYSGSVDISGIVRLGMAS